MIIARRLLQHKMASRESDILFFFFFFKLSHKTDVILNSTYHVKIFILTISLLSNHVDEFITDGQISYCLMGVQKIFQNPLTAQFLDYIIEFITFFN